MASSLVGPTLIYVQQELTGYVCSAWLIFGIPGCLLNVILLSRRNLRTISCCNYLLAASAIMIISLSLGCGSLLYTIDHPDPNTTIRAFCKLRAYIMQSTFMMARWMITIACIDRYSSCSRNARLRKFAQAKIARRAIIIIIGIWFILPVHTLVFYEIRPNANMCAIVYDRTAALYHSSYTIITGGIFPLTIMLICIILIRRNLVFRRNLQEELQNPNSQNVPQLQNRINYRHRDNHALAMLLLQVVVYSFVQAPQLIYTFYAAIASNVSNKSPDRLAIEKFAFFLAEICVYLFPVTAFYLYTLASRSFRLELFRLINTIPLRYFHRIEARVAPTQQTTNVFLKHNNLNTVEMVLKQQHQQQQ